MHTNANRLEAASPALTLVLCLVVASCSGKGSTSHAASNGQGGQPSQVVGGTSGVSGASGSGPEGGQGNGGTSTGDACIAPATGPVVITPNSGTFQGSVSVTLNVSNPDAKIRYTKDGTVPSASSTLYDGTPLTLTATTRLLARGFVGDQPDGDVTAALFVARGISATHDVPVILLDSYGAGKLSGEPSSRDFVDVAYLQYALSDGVVDLSSQPTVASLAAFHAHGQSSARTDKMPYRIELRGIDASDRDCVLEGLPAESDWVLVPPYADKTLIHNPFVYGLARDVGLLAPRFRTVELYVNDDKNPLSSDDYRGVYQLVEVIQNKKNRLNLAKLDAKITTLPDISGAYVFKFDHIVAEPPLVDCPNGASNCWHYLELVYPSPATDAQLGFLTNYLVDFNDALYRSASSTAQTTYLDYIDLKSFVDHVIICEATRNLDCYVRSQYFYKDRNEKIFAGPLWDFDMIAGVGLDHQTINDQFHNNIGTEGWQYEANSSRMDGVTSGWFTQLIADPQFKAALVSRWRELRAGVYSDSAIVSRVDGITKGLAAAAHRNFTRWDILTQGTVNNFTSPTEPTWEGQVAYMKQVLKERAAWIDSQWQ
jgi:hypothetical protein